MMKTHSNRRRPLRRKADAMAWQQTIDRLAIRLCPADEWEAYMSQINRLEWLAQQVPEASGHLHVFPIWKKYRPQAQRLATLYQAMPILQHLPLRFATILGKLLF